MLCYRDGGRGSAEVEASWPGGNEFDDQVEGGRRGVGSRPLPWTKGAWPISQHLLLDFAEIASAARFDCHLAPCLSPQKSHCDHPQAVGRLDAFENRGGDPWSDLAEPAVLGGTSFLLPSSKRNFTRSGPGWKCALSPRESFSEESR